ncbi:hypothetical protein PG997_013669 [Apiospora hydei]|uniref:Uncharacterized protein n=1 Tax=Apiospora hydei TaxID=1337664 RepID=A0ABR1V7K6_9PEZI
MGAKIRRSVRCRQLIRAFEAQSQSQWTGTDTATITPEHIAKARKLLALFEQVEGERVAAEGDLGDTNDEEESWPKKWETNPSSLPAFLDLFQKWDMDGDWQSKEQQQEHPPVEHTSRRMQSEMTQIGTISAQDVYRRGPLLRGRSQEATSTGNAGP